MLIIMKMLNTSHSLHRSVSNNFKKLINVYPVISISKLQWNLYDCKRKRFAEQQKYSKQNEKVHFYEATFFPNKRRQS